MAKRLRAGEPGPSAPQPATAAEPAPEEGPATSLQDVLLLGPAVQAVWACLGSEARRHARLTCRTARAALDACLTAVQGTDAGALQHLNASWSLRSLRLHWSTTAKSDAQLAAALRSLPAAFRQRITDLQLPNGAVEAAWMVSSCQSTAT